MLKDTKETLKMQLWIEIAKVVAGSSNSVHKNSMVSWADYAVEEFEKRFSSVVDSH